MLVVLVVLPRLGAFDGGSVRANRVKGGPVEGVLKGCSGRCRTLSARGGEIVLRPESRFGAQAFDAVGRLLASIRCIRPASR